jgi:dTDP-4-amino-4,6-dideoxygalactose transaminase
LTIDRASFISELRARNIGASVHFIPIPLHPFFQAIAPTMGNDCPECLKLYPRLVSLPLYPAMSEADVEYVAEAVREIVAKFRKPGIELPTYAQAGTAVRTAEGSAA